MLTNSCVIQCFIFVSVVYNPVLTADSTVKFLSVIFRHGDRTPTAPHELYPTDPYLKYDFKPGHGKLTKSGEMRVLNLGVYLRNTYKDLFAPFYIPGIVEAQSTNVNRTRESLKLVLKGLFPEIPVPVAYHDKITDGLLVPEICPAYVIDYLQAQRKSSVKEKLEKLKNFMKQLSKWTGKTIDSALEMYFIYSTLEAEKFMNLTLPSWTKGIYPDGDLFNGTMLEFDIMNYDNKMRRRNGGLLIRKFIKDMESVSSGKMSQNRKLMLYGAHDLNIVAVLKALNVYYPHLPKFSSAVIIELHEIKRVHYVQVNYYLGVPAEIKTLQIPGCQKLCPLDKFSDLMKTVIPSGSALICEETRHLLGFKFIKDAFAKTTDIFKGIF